MQCQSIQHNRLSHTEWMRGAIPHPAWTRKKGREYLGAIPEKPRQMDDSLAAVYEKQREARDSKAESYLYKHPLLTGSLHINGEAAQRWMDWRKSSGTDSRAYVENFEAEMKTRREPVTTEQLQQIRQQLVRWLDEQREDAARQLERLPEGVAKGLRAIFDCGMERLTDRMWADLLEIVQEHNKRLQNGGSHAHPRRAAVGAYVEWSKETDVAAQAYLETFADRLRTMGKITDEQEQTMRQQLRDWLGVRRSELTERLEETPKGIAKRIMKWADRSLTSLQERMWDTMAEAIGRHNQSLPPATPPPVEQPPITPPVGMPPVTPPPVLQPHLPGLPPDGRYRPGSIRLEITRGHVKSTLTLQDVSSDREKKAIFYVTDAAGYRKAVTVSFSDQRLQNEFDKRFRQSSMYGKTVSLEKFNRFVQRLKSSLEDITETDLTRLRSRLYGKEENARLETHIRTFIGIVYQMRR